MGLFTATLRLQFRANIFFMIYLLTLNCQTSECTLQIYDIQRVVKWEIIYTTGHQLVGQL